MYAWGHVSDCDTFSSDRYLCSHLKHPRERQSGIRHVLLLSERVNDGGHSDTYHNIVPNE